MTRMIVLAIALASAVAAAEVAKVPEPLKPTQSHTAPPRPNADRRDPFAGGGMADVAVMPVTPPRPTVVPPSPEIAKLGKSLAGAYKCKGVMLKGDGSSTPLEAKLTIKLDLDNAWIVTSLAETKAGGLKFDEYRTYDGTAKQWTRIQLASTSGHVISTSLGEKDGKWTWEGTATSSAGTMQVRDYEQMGKQLKVWGEAMLSGSWQKLYEATCTK